MVRPQIRLRAAAAGAAALIVAASDACACRCVEAESAAAHLRDTDVAFIGIPLSETRVDRHGVVTRFHVVEALKGGTPPPITAVRHMTESASCGLRYERGRQTVVLAERRPDGSLVTVSCWAPQFPATAYRQAARSNRPAQVLCDARPVQIVVGRRYTAAVGAQARGAAKAHLLRIRQPGRAYTDDRRSDRLNLDLDRAGRVRRAVCE